MVMTRYLDANKPSQHLLRHECASSGSVETIQYRFSPLGKKSKQASHQQWWQLTRMINS
jgi:hypothetical protein